MSTPISYFLVLSGILFSIGTVGESIKQLAVNVISNRVNRRISEARHHEGRMRRAEMVAEVFMDL